jgi:hypothetical protein
MILSFKPFSIFPLFASLYKFLVSLVKKMSHVTWEFRLRLLHKLVLISIPKILWDVLLLGQWHCINNIQTLQLTETPLKYNKLRGLQKTQIRQSLVKVVRYTWSQNVDFVYGNWGSKPHMRADRAFNSFARLGANVLVL